MRSQAWLGAALMRLPGEIPDEFEEQFWPLYPATHRGRPGKEAARGAFGRARRHHSLETIMEGLARYQFDNNPRYVPHAVTWLNQKRFLDVPVDLAADPWGLDAWFGVQPQPGDGLFAVRGYDITALQEILLASGLPLDWRGDLSLLGAWLVGGYRPDSIAEVIGEERARTRAEVRALRFFDGAVLRRALRWHAGRAEWIKG